MAVWILLCATMTGMADMKNHESQSYSFTISNYKAIIYTADPITGERILVVCILVPTGREVEIPTNEFHVAWIPPKGQVIQLKVANPRNIMFTGGGNQRGETLSAKFEIPETVDLSLGELKIDWAGKGGKAVISLLAPKPSKEN